MNGKLYRRYAEAWTAISDEQRESILAEVFAEKFRFLAPEFEGSVETLLHDIDGIQKQFPGARFEAEDVSAHHDVALLPWVLVLADETIAARGHDQIRVTPEQKIVSLTTFAPSVSRP